MAPSKLQQCLPFTVLKLLSCICFFHDRISSCNSAYRLRYWNACNGIVALIVFIVCCNSAYRLRYWNKAQTILLVPIGELQQCLPFTVLKLINITFSPFTDMKLQQCLPFTVLKLASELFISYGFISSCNSAYRLRYWNVTIAFFMIFLLGCNSTYHLRYWNCNFIKYFLSISALRCNSTYRLRYWNIAAFSSSILPVK